MYLRSNNTNIKISEFEKDKLVSVKFCKRKDWEVGGKKKTENKLNKKNLNIQIRTCHSKEVQFQSIPKWTKTVVMCNGNDKIQTEWTLY